MSDGLKFFIVYAVFMGVTMCCGMAFQAYTDAKRAEHASAIVTEALRHGATLENATTKAKEAVK